VEQQKRVTTQAQLAAAIEGISGSFGEGIERAEEPGLLERLGIGTEPPKPGDMPRGYGYVKTTEGGGLPGIEGGFSGLSTNAKGLFPFQVPTQMDLVTGQGRAGSWTDPDTGDFRVGVQGSSGLYKQKWGNQNSPAQFDMGVGTGSFDYSRGEDGLSVGAQASMAEAALTAGQPSDKRAVDEQVRIGLSAGSGGAGRVHWGDKDRDGHREYGFGVDAGPVSFDIKTEDPLRTAMKYNPVTSPFGAVADLIASDTNLTDSLLGTREAPRGGGGGNPLFSLALPHIMELASDPEKKLNSIADTASGAAGKAGNVLDTIGDWL
jgi:hypothetical protein